MSVLNIFSGLKTCTKLNICLKSICGACNQNNLFSNKAWTPTDAAAPGKKKTTPLPKITLLSGETVTITTLTEAQKLSKRRDLKLVKIVDLDTKTQRPVYKLMTGAEYLQEDLKQRELKKKERQDVAIKGEKMLLISENISEHDLGVHINKMEKWLAKAFAVRVVINGNASNMEKAEKIYQTIEAAFPKTMSNTKILQKRSKGNDIKFQVVRPRTKSSSPNDPNNEGNDEKKS